MQQKYGANEIQQAIEHFAERGYVIFKAAISTAVGESFWSAVEENITNNVNLQFHSDGKPCKQVNLSEDLRLRLPRIIDIQGHVPLALHLMFCDPISGFLGALYGTKPTCLQTLTYKFSSEQGAHSDLHLVSPPYAGAFDRTTLVAVWIAFEAAGERNGALVIYPGSHKLPKKRLDLDFKNDYGAYMKYLDTLCEQSGCPPEAYEAEAGEMLFWHGDFVHAGGPIPPQLSRPTRRSMVCHYAVVPSEQSSLTPDWIRMKTFNGSYYVPSSCIVRGQPVRNP